MRLICLILTVSAIFMFVSGTESIKPNENITTETVIDYGESEVFSLEDRQEAVKLILNEVCDWNTIEQQHRWNAIEQLHNVRYGGDEASLEEKGYNGYNDIMVFYSDFKTGRSADGGFNRDLEYRNWEWFLGKNPEGQWKLLTWGYD